MCYVQITTENHGFLRIQSFDIGKEKRRMSYKEKREFEQLERDIAALEEEQRQIEEQLCSGTLSIEELTEKSKRLPLLKDELDEKSMRWLELSEIEN